MTQAGLVAGIDLGGTNTQIGLVDRDGVIVARRSAKTEASQGVAAVLDNITEGIRGAAGDAGVEAGALDGVGFAAPGGCDVERGIVLQTGNMGWPHNFPLADEMSGRLPGPRIVVDNDVNAAAFGEFRFGAGREAADLLAVWVGTGIGGGVVLGGTLHYGSLGTAGEIGHVVALPNAVWGETILEHACSRRSVMIRLAKLLKTGAESVLHEIIERDHPGVGPDAMDARCVGEAYGAGDPLTRRVVDESADLLGTVIAGVVNVLAVELVVLGGGLTEVCGDDYVRAVGRSAEEKLFPRSNAERFRVAKTELEANAGVLGAAAIAWDRLGVN